MEHECFRTRRNKGHFTSLFLDHKNRTVVLVHDDLFINKTDGVIPFEKLINKFRYFRDECGYRAYQKGNGWDV